MSEVKWKVGDEAWLCGSSYFLEPYKVVVVEINENRSFKIGVKCPEGKAFLGMQSFFSHKYLQKSKSQAYEKMMNSAIADKEEIEEEMDDLKFELESKIFLIQQLKDKMKESKKEKK